MPDDQPNVKKQGKSKSCDRIIRVPEARKIAGNVAVSTLNRWEREGKFPRRRKIEGVVGYLKSELDTWVKSLPFVPLSTSLEKCTQD